MTWPASSPLSALLKCLVLTTFVSGRVELWRLTSSRTMVEWRTAMIRPVRGPTAVVDGIRHLWSLWMEPVALMLTMKVSRLDYFVAAAAVGGDDGDGGGGDGED